MGLKLDIRVLILLYMMVCETEPLREGKMVIVRIQKTFFKSVLDAIRNLDFRFIKQCGNTTNSTFALFVRGPNVLSLKMLSLSALSSETFEIVFPLQPGTIVLETAVNKTLHECLESHRRHSTPPPGMESFGCKSRYRMGVDEAWGLGYSGEGVVVAVTDAGINPSLPDLHNVVNESLSYNFVDNSVDFRPGYSDNEYSDHGNRCAGLIAARRDNNICGEGIAYHATIAALKIVDTGGDYIRRGTEKVYRKTASKALVHRLQDVHIYSNSWGSDYMFYDGQLINDAVQTGVREGRGGRGAIYVFPSTRVGSSLTNTEFTITVNGVGNNNSVPDYATSDASVITSVYGENRANTSANMCISSHYGAEKCSRNFIGTSRAVAEASGIIALILEKRKDLTWRDVQYIAIEASDPIDTDRTKTNGAGKQYHPVFGFGLLDAFKAVTLASQWKNVGQRVLKYVNKVFHKSNDGCSYSFTIHIPPDDKDVTIESIEHVIATISYTTENERNVKISLYSASGTESVLLDRKQSTHGPIKRKEVKLMSTHFWGERFIIGLWKLQMEQTGSNCSDVDNSIDTLSLHIYYLAGENIDATKQTTTIDVGPVISTSAIVTNRTTNAIIVCVIVFVAILVCAYVVFCRIKRIKCDCIMSPFRRTYRRFNRPQSNPLPLRSVHLTLKVQSFCK